MEKHMTVHPPYARDLALDLTLQDFQQTAARLQGQVLTTPVWRWQTGVVQTALSPQTEVWLKLELFQIAGSFKLRGALNCIQAMDLDAKRRGVVAVSAGNHAIAMSYAARLVGISAKVVMPQHVSPARIEACRDMGAEVVLQADVHAAFEHADELVAREGRTLIHPFDGPLTAQGTGTVGLELMHQISGLDAVLVPVGGGGLLAGIASCVKRMNKRCQVFGVEPEGADAMTRSFEAGQPVRLERVNTVADSLGAPYAMPYSYGLCKQHVDGMVHVSDDAICQAMYYTFRDMKLAVEPAAATALAALLGPLREQLNGKKVALIVCGSNQDAVRFSELLARGQALAVNAIPGNNVSS
jgi:threonine dehydratase